MNFPVVCPVRELYSVSRNVSSFTKSPEYFFQGSSSLACFIWSRVLLCFKRFLHRIARFLQHSKIGWHIVEVRDRAMPWDHLNIWWQLRYDLLHAIDHAIAAAPLSGRFANVVLCNDGRLLLRICVAAGVIAVEVRIDDETDGLISDTFQCSLNLLGQPGVLIVDEDVVADGRSNVSRSLAFQHV